MTVTIRGKPNDISTVGPIVRAISSAQTDKIMRLSNKINSKDRCRINKRDLKIGRRSVIPRIIHVLVLAIFASGCSINKNPQSEPPPPFDIQGHQIVCSLDITATDYQTSDQLDTESLADKIAVQWVILSTQDNPGTVHLWDRTLSLKPNTSILIGTSSDLIYAATLLGSISDQTGNIAAPGQMIVWHHFGAIPIQVMEYWMQRLAVQMKEVGQNDLAHRMSRSIEAQERERYWGMLRPTMLDVGQATSFGNDKFRRQYCNAPALIYAARLTRQDSSSPELIAEMFLGYLKAQDFKHASELFSPEVFAHSDRYIQRIGMARQEFLADMLWDATWRDTLDLDTLAMHKQEDGSWIASCQSGDRVVILSLSQFDSYTFVSGWNLSGSTEDLE